MNIPYKGFAISFLTLIVTLCICEAGLRLAGFVPGKILYTQWFTKVDYLTFKRGFIADSSGIFKVDPAAALWIDSVIECHKNDTVTALTSAINDSLVNEIYWLGFQSLNVIRGSLDNQFTHFYQHIKSDSADEFNKAVKDYVFHPINADGFRSIAFKPYSSKRKKVLLIGDSFAWGHSAYDISNSFADVLLASGYIIYNAGISGADPPQYNAIAEKYIPLLKPDVVVVDFYMGNDVQYYNRPVITGKPIFYSTNAGSLFACPQAEYFNDAQQAYDFAASQLYMPQETITDKICAKTAIGTLLYMVAKKVGLIYGVRQKYLPYVMRQQAQKQAAPTADGYMDSIEKICQANDCRFVLLITPELKKTGLGLPESYNNLFSHRKFYCPADISRDDYRQVDGHLNDEGQKHYARFLDSLLKSN